jgi:hypothetical protein
VSFAAGHRPCAECRRADYNAYRTSWAAGLSAAPPNAQQINHQLHGERIVRGTSRRRLHELTWPELPAGTFVLLDGVAALVLDEHLTTWTTDGYGARRARPRAGTATVITPPSTVAVLRAGYPVQFDAAAR